MTSFLSSLTKYPSIWVPLLILIIQLFQRRRDDKRIIQLKRLNSQLSDLYGPLYAWYEIGRANFEPYIKSGNATSFTDPNYALWLNEVRTNSEMENIIIKKC